LARKKEKEKEKSTFLIIIIENDPASLSNTLG